MSLLKETKDFIVYGYGFYKKNPWELASLIISLIALVASIVK